MIDTLGNIDWLLANEDALKKLLPDTWTHVENLDGPRLAYGLKLLGVDWRSVQEFGRAMVFLERVGIMQRQNGYQVRANPGKLSTSSRTHP